MEEHRQPPGKSNISEIIKEGEIPVFYSNGFTFGYSATEVHLIFNHHGNTSCVIQMAFPIAKSALKALQATILDYEKKTGASIPSVEEVKESIIPKKE
jgi:hypothetical protein